MPAVRRSRSGRAAGAVLAVLAAALQLARAAPPFTDFRGEAPGRAHRITVDDLPAPYATESANNGASIVPRPAGALPSVPPGFRANLFASGFAMPRVLRVAPGGDIFLAESGAGRLLVFSGIAKDGTAQRTEVFAEGLNRPYGIAFYPPGDSPQWIYVGDTDAVLRFAYRPGQLHAQGAPERLAELPHGGSHWTRDLAVAADGQSLFVAVGSATNVGSSNPFRQSEETHRANILVMSPDGTQVRVYASGIRNPSGVAVEPRSGRLWCVVNERDGLGDDLVPDYVTSVREGGFYGWPWWYLGAHQDPRHAGKHPELRDRVVVPDVLIQPHDAPLQLVFYESGRFPDRYRGDLFVTSHGSWNRSVRTGYEVLRVPLHRSGRPDGGYEDFATGFVLADGSVWGRPVGVTVAPDGSLLVSDDGSGSVWRIDYVGPD